MSSGTVGGGCADRAVTGPFIGNTPQLELAGRFAGASRIFAASTLARLALHRVFVVGASTGASHRDKPQSPTLHS